MKSILTIIKKELKRFFTDKRTLFAIVGPGILLFLMYSLMGKVITNSVNEAQSITEFTICVINEPNELKITNEEFKIEYINCTLDEAMEKLKNKELDLYVVYEENFMTKTIAYNYTSGEKAPEIEIYYNSAKDGSSVIYSYYMATFEAFETSISNKFDINRNEKKYDLATKEESSARVISMVLPFILVLMLFSGSMAICTESIAGEKERGTIATLLATPAKRYEIAIGKIASLGIVSLVSAVSTSIGLFASLPSLFDGADVSISIYGFGTIAISFIIIILTVLLFATILALISTLSKTIKEASAYAIPVMVVIMGICMINLMGTKAETNVLLYMIPVYNSVQCFTGIFSLSIDPMCFLVTSLSNIVFIGLGIFALTKMFNSEKIMFSK